ncbi:SNF2 family N-terminal domain-containing protein [Mycena metata]|uniref:SNF2 family N-terminal domain-containing protein n=1 Tax=Mycena metata TaxID=1033252 RepID=A0AAD7IK39_9AGAR|nr:SNF2 family N-terminal domain-containing protein [Mycena metata]
MGLGKTLQTIAFCAHLRHERRSTRPFLVVCPLSVLHNWVEEFKRFAPKIPVVLYHGTPAERAEMRRTKKAKALDEAHDAHFAAFPVVITTYDLIIRDRPVLGGIPWGYIVVDEGHRLKNMHCALMREVKRYSSAGRMVLTGTPLHVGPAFLFSLPRMSALLPSARMGTFISTLHTILKPFLLRRMKADVLGSALPPKKSYVLYARLSARQHDAYEAVLKGEVRAWVAGGMGASSASTSASRRQRTRGGRCARGSGGTGRARRTMRRERRRRRRREEGRRRRLRSGGRYTDTLAAKHVNNMKLQNTVMQLRKVCSHPFLCWPAREAELVGASGKMLLLDRLLGEFQFTTMLDIIEDWAVDMKGWKICRIDGTTPPLERRDQMNVFQSAGDALDCTTALPPQYALMAVLGVNLTAADTVIFYDQDWAQDRAHRIGQTKPGADLPPCERTYDRGEDHAAGDGEAEARGAGHRQGWVSPFPLCLSSPLSPATQANSRCPPPQTPTRQGKRTTMAEMAADLLRLEGEQIDVLPTTTHAGDADVLSDADLEALLDRSPEVFADRGTGWKSSAKGQAAFAVFEPPADAGSDALAGLMDGEEAVEA